MRTLVFGLLLSAAAWAQTNLPLMASAATVAPSFSSSRTVSVAPIIKTAPPVEAQPQVEKRDHDSHRWVVLATASHSAAAFDAWSTRQAVHAGGTELNPLLKPFANSNAIYPALQVGPTMADYLGRRMMRSNHAIYRNLWWVPQAASTAISLTCGIKNTRNF